MDKLPAGVTQDDLNDLLDNPPASMLVDVPPTEEVEARLAAMQKKLTDINSALEVTGHLDAQKSAKESSRRRFIMHEIPYWERRLKWARRRDDLSAGRPPGCWCLGLGGRGERYVTPTDRSYLEYCSCLDGQAARQAALVAAEKWRGKLEQYERDANLKRIWGGSGVPERYKGFTIMSFPSSPENQLTVRKLLRWCDEGDWLYLYGRYGVGKTGLAVGILRDMAGRGKTVLFQTVPELLDRIRATYNQSGDVREGANEREVMESLKTVEFLVLDDLGTEKVSEWVTEKLFIIINHRYNNGLRTVITSNITLDELSRRVGERIVWRIVERSKVYELRGPNLRER